MASSAAPRLGSTVDARFKNRLALILLALATTSPITHWASAGVGALDASHLLLLGGGLVSGFLAGLLGIGGALISLPVLYAALPGLGVAHEQVPTVAVATALVAMLPTTMVAAWRQHVRGALDLSTLGRMTMPMAGGAMIGASLAAQLHGPVLALMFAIQSLWYGGRLVADRSDGVTPSTDALALATGRIPCWIAAPTMAAFCACVGMGGGSVVTPYLQRRYGLPFRHAVATASALNLCIAIGGSLAFMIVATGGGAGAASANLPAAMLLAGGAVAAVSLGVATAHRLPTGVFRSGVGAINLVAAVILILQVARAA